MKLKLQEEPQGITRSIMALHPFRLFRARIVRTNGVTTGTFIKIFNNNGDVEIIRMDKGHSLRTLYSEHGESDLVLRRQVISQITNIVYLDADIVITGEAKG